MHLPTINDIFILDQPSNADLILVCGSSDPTARYQRVARAAELFAQDLAPTILFSGGKGPPPEAVQMQNISTNFNVPTEHIILETSSKTTRGNAGLSRDILNSHDRLRNLTKVILVTSPSHMFRALMAMEQQFPEAIEFICCPSAEACTLTTWHGHPLHEREVCRELLLIDKFARDYGDCYPRRFCAQNN